MATPDDPRCCWPGLVVTDEMETFTVPRLVLPGITDLPPFNMLNGDPESMVPFSMTSTIPAAYHWVPLNGIKPEEAMNHLVGFVMSHIYQLTVNKPARMTDADVRNCGIILGVSRAVMTADYGLERSKLNPDETALPVLCAVDKPNVTGTYEVLVPATPATVASDHRAILTTPLTFTDTEQMLINVIKRSAPAIIPLQGYSLIVDSYHYLSDANKQSSRAFKAVENQVWVSGAWKEFFATRKDLVRDVMWHKAGHPVIVSLKEEAASSEQVKANLMQARLGSAAARLPYLEPELRAAETYLKMMQVVDAVWRTMDGMIDTTSISNRINAVKKIPRKTGDPDINPPLSIPGNKSIIVKNRKEALAELARVIAGSTHVVAQAFGFYCAMMDAKANETGTASRDTLRYAHSLQKLASNSPAFYFNGLELHKDYKAQKAYNRAQKLSE